MWLAKYSFEDLELRVVDERARWHGWKICGPASLEEAGKVLMLIGRREASALLAISVRLPKEWRDAFCSASHSLKAQGVSAALPTFGPARSKRTANG